MTQPHRMCHVFWGMTSHDLHQHSVRGRLLYGHGLDCLSAYAAIGSTLHFTRLNERPAAAPRWVMFNMGRLVRSYFDAIIACSAIRWAQPGELWWGADRDDPDDVRGSVSFLLAQAAAGTDDYETDESTEQVILLPEMLLAAAQGKVPTVAHDLIVASATSAMERWPDDPGTTSREGH